MKPYLKLAIMLALNGVIMYLVMYSMINSFGDFYLNINKFYMTLLMVMPMAVMMLAMMRSMYTNQRLNYALIGASVLLFVLSFAAVRWQGAVGNTQFLKSMIPHHSGAIVMCREADLSDSEIRTLCESIIRSQQSEIDQMKAILARNP